MAKNRAEENERLVLAGDVEESSCGPVVKTRKDFTKPDPKSGKARPYGGTGEGNPKHANVPPEKRCTARRAKDGKPCQKLKKDGAEVCGTHGGRAPQVMRKAMARLQNNADKLAQALVAIAMDEEVSEVVRLKAIDSALDRAGLKSSEKVELQHSVAPWEAALQGAMRIERVPSERVREEDEQRARDMDDDRY